MGRSPRGSRPGLFRTGVLVPLTIEHGFTPKVLLDYCGSSGGKEYYDMAAKILPRFIVFSRSSPSLGSGMNGARGLLGGQHGPLTFSRAKLRRIEFCASTKLQLCPEAPGFWPGVVHWRKSAYLGEFVTSFIGHGIDFLTT